MQVVAEQRPEVEQNGFRLSRTGSGFVVCSPQAHFPACAFSSAVIASRRFVCCSSWAISACTWARTVAACFEIRPTLVAAISCCMRTVVRTPLWSASVWVSRRSRRARRKAEAGSETSRPSRASRDRPQLVKFAREIRTGSG